ncbi:hypothetical protein [Caldimonas thermodepolymerans]|jgi:hypothetical protein|nr:hypothetical protein [Caldimonas thermodepolymerans]UZG43193.1 hypothetical protein ONZ46_12335 [Caldimonas thermodepolymerans]UZG46859.1 hypothetical protein ONS87_12985 [Caldimonas thermodepolymerans]
MSNHPLSFLPMQALPVQVQARGWWCAPSRARVATQAPVLAAHP